MIELAMLRATSPPTERADSQLFFSEPLIVFILASFLAFVTCFLVLDEDELQA
jgi:hypothetical protein